MLLGFGKKPYTIHQLSRELDGNKKRSGYTNDFLKEMVDKQILVFDEMKLCEGRWWKYYYIDTKALRKYIMNTEWYSTTRELVNRIEGI